jgi:hypothetical protein
MSELLPYKANKADLKMKANFQKKDAIGATHDKKINILFMKYKLKIYQAKP